MKLSTAFLYGKLTRQIFAIFLVFALLPVSILSWVAIERISDSTAEQVSQGVENEVKNISYLVLERLQFAESTLEMHLRGIKSTELERLPGSDKLPLSIQPLANYAPHLTNSSRTHLATGRGLLIHSAAQDQPLIQMVMALQPNQLERGVIAATLPVNYILGEEESRNLASDICIYDHKQVLLFSTSAALCAQFLQAVGDTFVHKGEVLFGPDQGYFSHYWSLFLNAKLGVSPWVVAVIQRENDIFSESQSFKNTFLIVALGVILSLSLVSVVLIRRKMAPLPEIMAAIQRVGEQRYDQPVTVSSGDEFEELADAFNNMSGKVDRQIITLGSLADIDQLILTRVKKEDLVRVVLERTSSVIACDDVAVLMLEQAETAGTLYGLASEGGEDFTEVAVSLNDQLIGELSSGGQWLKATDPNNSSWFSSFEAPTTFLYLLPVHHEDGLAAVIALAYAVLPRFEDEEISTAKSYAGRIAVALANAEWEDKLYKEAHYDNLTGLPNRLSLMDNLQRTIERAERYSEPFAVMFFDLDDFKLVNDSLGHIAGDNMIVDIGQRLQTCLRAGDIVARMGGDEFVIITTTFESDEEAVTGASHLARKIAEAISLPLLVSGQEIRPSNSLGITLYPRDGEDVENLLKNADAAMYHAKSKGQGNFVFFSERLNAESEALMQLSTEIKRALETQEFQLHYQPKVDVASGRIVGAEALIRWFHPQRGTVSPDQFIGVAERMGLISAIGDWTLHAACRQIVQWREEGIAIPLVSVNISAIQLHQENIATKVKQLLHDYQIPAEYLEIEIVEGVLVEDMEAATVKLSSLRELGVQISIDDYGTGYSSLGYIKTFPVDALKIDRCFIVNLCSDAADQAIVKSTIVLAHNLGMKIIAEGVEDAEQVAMLKEFGCDQIQGYFYSKPVPAAEFAELLHADHAA